MTDNVFTLLVDNLKKVSHMMYRKRMIFYSISLLDSQGEIEMITKDSMSVSSVIAVVMINQILFWS